MSDFIGVEQTIFVSDAGWIMVAVGLLAALILTIRRPAWGMGLVVAATPFYMVRGDLGLPTTVLELLIGVVVLGWLCRVKRYPPHPDWSWVWLGIAVIGGLAAALASPDQRMGLGLWRAFWLEPAAFFIAAQAVFHRERTVPLFYGLLGSLGIVAVWAGVLAVTGSDLSYDNRLVGPYQSANFLAMTAVPVILAAALWPNAGLPRDRFRRRLLRIGPAVLGGALLLATQSRGGYLALGAGLLVGGFYWRHRLNRRQAITLGLTATATAAVTIPFLFSRPAPIVPVRRLLWERSVEFIVAHPLFGLGPNQFQARLNEKFAGDVFLERYFLPFAPNSHNLFLVLWIDWGVAGLVGFLGLVGWAIRRLVIHWGRAAVVPAAMLAAMLVHGMVDTPVLKNDLAIIFMVMLVLAGTLGRADRPRRRAA